MKIKGLMIVALVGALLAFGAGSAMAWSYVYPVGTNPGMQFAMGEGAQITFSGTGGITTIFDPAINGTTYFGTTDSPGGDDFAIAFINKRTTPVFSVALSGSGNGGGLFAFENAYSATWPGVITDDNYGGGSVAITTASSSPFVFGTVFFTGGLQPGMSAWFDFESAPVGLNISPIPGSVLLLGSGLVGLLGFRRRS